VQYGGVHQHDVGHGDERCDARYNFCAPSGSKLSKLEVFFRFANQDLFTIADVATQDSGTVIARCREIASMSEVSGATLRTCLSPAMKRCYEVVGNWMTLAGMTHSVDAAGNLRGLRPGRVPGKRAFLMGSHLDTVSDAGAFDGILGVILAIAIVENVGSRSLPFDLEIIGFCEEEGVRFPPFVGSRALVGLLDELALAQADKAGISLAQALRDFGLDPAAIPSLALSNRPFGFLEFHIEQGPVLDAAAEAIGIVDSIVGQIRASFEFSGSANHAGTTPMHLRHDALTAAAQWISAVESVALAIPDLVATTGMIHAEPNISNVVPGRVSVSLDLRHADGEVRRQTFERVWQAATDIARQRAIKVSWTNPVMMETVQMDAALTCKLAASAPAGTRHMVSGAGHDAMILAPHIPSAMLFLRSPGGVSHHPDEDVLPQDVGLALSVGQRFIEALIAEYKSS